MSMKKALASAERRTVPYDKIMRDPTDAQERYSNARQALRLAQLRGGDSTPEAQAADAAAAEAEAALRACTYRIVFQNLGPDEFEALVSAHEPTPEQQKDGAGWNTDTFRPALIAACAVDSDMTEQEWIEELSSPRWSIAERDEVFLAALNVNVAPRSVVLPKG